ncbi:hypothetical protein [Luteitalea sp.]|uniref:hypothetical protein n=1 Tax=Luteitalea sp. TaxID=2004800 RepID=UPI0025C73661|nr:hypothetical protein [Luteitalea sp.]
MKTLDLLARLAIMAAGIVLWMSNAIAQAPVSGVFFSEGWESGATGATFNSRNYGSTTSPQFRVQSAVRASGGFALEHVLTAGLGAGSIHYATQHFGDAVSGPVHPVGQGQHFFDLYVQFRVYYSPNFDVTNSRPKQFIIGTQDERRHDATCCNPWVSNYLTIFPPGPTWGITVGEANAKQATSGQFAGLVQNRGGYSAANPFVTQTGRWYTVEVRRRLNDPGVRNGVFQMWVDGALIAEYASVLYRVPFDGTFGSNMAYGTNFAMISDYMANGSNRDQSIFYDDVKFSTTPIGVGSTLPTAPTNLRIIVPPGPSDLLGSSYLK